MEGTIGEIRLFAGNFAPVGWNFCDGSDQSISDYTAAYTIIGTTYGGDGMTTFGMPDLRGRIPVHPGQGLGLTQISAGQVGGEENHTLTVNEIPGHGHGVALISATATVKVSSADATAATPVANCSIAGRANTDAKLNTYNSEAPDVTINAGLVSPIAVPNGVTGASVPHQNMQQFQVLNYIVCLVGVFPSRP